MVQHIPDGYHTVTPYITIDDARKFIDFIKTAFDATVPELMKRSGTPRRRSATRA